VSVSDVASVLSTTTGSPPPVGGPAALIAANMAYGATAAALANVSGKLLCQLLFLCHCSDTDCTNPEQSASCKKMPKPYDHVLASATSM